MSWISSAHQERKPAKKDIYDIIREMQQQIDKLKAKVHRLETGKDE